VTNHPSVAERAERGRAARAKVPRSSQGAYEPASDRPDPVALLEAQAATRVPELVPIRYGPPPANTANGWRASRRSGASTGATLARAHARSGDGIGIAAYLGTGAAIERAMLAFGEAYADQNALDYAALAAAVKTGRVAAETGL
jgi:hypothetical protein